jgi:hypothetical protein
VHVSIRQVCRKDLKGPPTAVGGIQDLKRSTNCRWRYLERSQGVCKIPPTAVGGSFRSFLLQAPLKSFQSHQRQLVDRSDPFYSKRLSNPSIPPTAVGGSFRSLLLQAPLKSFNPPTAVGGSFRSFLPQAPLESHQRQLVDRSDPFYLRL